MQEKSSKNDNNIKARKVIQLLKSNGMTLREIANELNKFGFKTAKGFSIQPEQVELIIQ